MKGLRLAATTAEMKSMLAGRQMTLLRAIVEADADIQFATVADIEGKQIARSDDQIDLGINYGDREYFRTIQKNRRNGAF